MKNADILLYNRNRTADISMMLAVGSKQKSLKQKQKNFQNL